MTTSLAPPDAPTIKGAALREFLLWYERTRGPERTLAIARGVPPDLAPLIRINMPAFGVLASSWYPVALSHYYLDAVMEGNEGRELAREANRDVVPRMIHGVYRVIYRTIASPELYARHVGRQWRKLHSTGERTFEIRGPGEARSTVANWPGHHPMLCWITIYTMVSLFETMGFSRVDAERVRCVAHGGGGECVTILRWSK